MTENNAQTTKYAIRLVDGVLMDGTPILDLFGARFESVNGASAMLWESERDAELHHDALRNLLTQFGLSTQYFCAVNRVVAVDFVTTAQVRELIADTTVKAEVAAVPRTWATVGEIPSDVAFGAIGYELFRWRRAGSTELRQWYGDRYDGFTDADSVDETWSSHGFVEVLP